MTVKFQLSKTIFRNLREIDDHSHYNLVYIKKHPYSELFWFAFPAFAYSLPLRIQSKYEKMRTRITLNTDTFLCSDASCVYLLFMFFMLQSLAQETSRIFLNFFLITMEAINSI